MFVLYGGNEFYRVWNKLGGHNFFEELGLPENYDKISSPYEQVDLLVDALSRTNTLNLVKLLQKVKKKLKKIEKIILEHYKKIMTKVVEYISE